MSTTFTWNAPEVLSLASQGALYIMALSSLPAVTVCKSEPIDVDSDDDTEVIKTFINL